MVTYKNRYFKASYFNFIRRINMADMPKQGDTLCGFIVTGQGTIKMLGARTYEFYHEFSGARLLYIQNDDSELGFNLIYRTPQLDERDLNHILEHLVLSSCRKYPSRDIFFDMDSKSCATFMNGLTDNTFTCYPVCAQSQNQLIKLIDVFLSCMEEPDALRDKNFFLREGIRFELEDMDGPLTMQGTVLSEDWGHLTDIQENADSFMAHALYPGQIASNLLGRAHFHYQDITFEQVQNTFYKFYEYSNSLIVLYGDMDYRKVLEFLHMEHLSKTRKRDVDLSRYMSEIPASGYTEQTVKSPAYQGSPVEQGCIIDYAVDLSDCTQEDLVYWDLLADILDNDTSALHRYTREAGLNNVIEVYLDSLLMKPSLKFRLRNGDEEQKQPFRDSIQRALEEVSLQGIPDALFKASMKENRLADALTREASHLGFNISEEIGRYWSQTGRTDYFELYESSFQRFSGESGQSIIKRLAALALRPKTSAMVVTVPDPGMAELLEARKEEFLEQKKASLSQEQKALLLKETRDFQAWNAKSWGNMDFLIRPEELPDPEKPLPFNRKEYGPITIYTSAAAVEAVGSYQLYFDLSSIPQEDLNYLSLYEMLLTELDTDRFSVEQQKTLEQEYLHDCTFDEVYPGPGSGAYSRPMMSVFWCGLTEDFENGLDFLLDIMGGGDYSDTDTIIRVLEKYLPDYDLSKSESASALAFSLAEGYIRQEYRFRNMLNSQQTYYFLKDVLKRLKTEDAFKSQISDKLQSLPKAILKNGPLVFMAAASENDLESIKEQAILRWSALHEENGQSELDSQAECERPVSAGHPSSGIYQDDRLYHLTEQKQRLAVCVEASCQETRMIGDFQADSSFKGRYLPFLMALADKYLKPAIRYQGNAYDCGIDFYIPTGYFTLWSTADTGVKHTLELFKSAGQALKTLPLTAQDLDGYILNAYAQANPPDGALNKHMRHMRRHMAGISTEQVALMTADIRNARLEHQQEAAVFINAVLEKGPAVTAGNERCIMKDQECFDEIFNYKSR